MQAFTKLDGLVVPLDRANVDTDAIIPKQFLKSIKRTGFGPHLFDEWRYLDPGTLGQDCSTRPRNPGFSLNEARYQGAQILLARENFGCGSSREHAPWALLDFGIRALIAPSFAEIFQVNCLKNGILPVVVEPGIVDRLFDAVSRTPGYRLAVDLMCQTVTEPGGEVLPFSLDSGDKHSLLNGLDDIGSTLAVAERIRSYEAQRRLREPWLFA
ncbi:MAG: leuD2 [Gammaproteobacteria bacterium]|nr:leuD2 [Gammaproteobacteria bacterium]